MNKIVVIGDIHGRDIWKKIIEKEKDADKIIFMGDYFDSFDIPFYEQFDNWIEIIKFKKENPEKVVLLIGNHCFHYISETEKYSGYQRNYALKIGTSIQNAIDTNLMQIAYLNNKFLFTHAGVSQNWLESHVESPLDLEYTPDVALTKLFISRPESFNFNGSDPSGDDITQSPIWIRPKSLDKVRVPGFIHVVGHTGTRGIETWLQPPKFDEGIILVDSLRYKEYLIIKNDRLEVGKVNENNINE